MPSKAARRLKPHFHAPAPSVPAVRIQVDRQRIDRVVRTWPTLAREPDRRCANRMSIKR